MNMVLDRMLKMSDWLTTVFAYDDSGMASTA